MSALGPYRTLGRSGLRVSRLGLGTMTFGEAAWGCDAATADALMRRYVEAGGNLIDTADRYAGGGSEEIVGAFLEREGLREQVVLATKYSLGARDGDPNSGGNGRKSMMRALEGSLRRLRTDHVDLYYLHAWDGFTPVDEVVGALDDLVRQGKVRYVALSDVPAWYASRAVTLAECHGRARPIAVQLEYSLAERGVEYEFPAMCEALGTGIVAWSPLGSGLLSGKYAAEGAQGRLALTRDFTPPALAKLTPRNAEIVTTLAEVAASLDRAPAQVAINWVASRPAVACVLLGARNEAQLEQTLDALEFELPADALARLDAATAPALEKPYSWFGWGQGLMNGGMAAHPQAYLARG